MAKFTDAVEATLKNYFNAGDQPTEAQFTALMAAIQAAIDEHDHTGALPGDGMVLNDIPLVALGSYAEGRIILGGGADWTHLAAPGAAGHALVSTPASFAWDSTPTWTGLHLFNAGIRNPAQPAFNVHMNNADQAFNAGVLTTLEFDTETFDVGGNFNTGTYKFVAPLTGKYMFTAMCRVNTLIQAADHYSFNIVTTGQNYNTLTDPGQFAGNVNFWPFSLQIIVAMNATDEAYVTIKQTGGGNGSAVEGAVAETRFMGYMLG